jgi:hypothetical protein
MHRHRTPAPRRDHPPAATSMKQGRLHPGGGRACQKALELTRKGAYDLARRR